MCAILGAVIARGSIQAQDSTQARRDTSAARARSPVDSVRADSIRRARAQRDSIALARQRALELRRKADTVKAPLAHPEMPVSTSVGAAYQWDRASVFTTGALTLGELTDLVPGVTGYRAGWIGSPHVAAYGGSPGRVRVFYDGLEIDALDRGSPGVLDLAMVDFWQVEDTRFEPTADGLRVNLGSWRVRSTTPSTRVDVSTGDLETNSYRGYFGRRYDGGQVLQVGASQYTSTDTRGDLGDAHNLSLWGRAGWSKKKWSVDASLVRTSREHSNIQRLAPGVAFGNFDGALSTSYARVGYGDPDSGVWAQGILGAVRFVTHHASTSDTVRGPGGVLDTVTVSNDTTNSEPQYVVAGGWSSGPLRLSATGRYRRRFGQSDFAPTLRAAFQQRALTISAYTEHSGLDSALRADVSARFEPLPFFALGASVAREAPVLGRVGPASLAARVEAGLRLQRVWLTAGGMTRDTALVRAPAIFDPTFALASVGRRTGVFATVRGKFWGDLGIDAWGIRYPSAGPYLPQYQTRAQLYFESRFPGRFPSGNLHILAAITNEYRSFALFPVTQGPDQRSSQYRVWGAILEIRLLSATISYQYRNFLNAEYTQIPGYIMPRPVNFYGIRWNFVD